MLNNPKEYFLTMLRAQFDACSTRQDAEETILAAIFISDENNYKVKEMISDFEFEYNTTFQNN